MKALCILEVPLKWSFNLEKLFELDFAIAVVDTAEFPSRDKIIARDSIVHTPQSFAASTETA